MNEGSSMDTEPGLSEMATDQLHSLRATAERRLKETAGHNKAMRLEEEIAAITEEIRVRGEEAKPDGEVFTLRIELGNAAMHDAADVADALARVASEVGETGSWEGSIRDGNGNTVGRYLLGGEVV